MQNLDSFLHDHPSLHVLDLQPCQIEDLQLGDFVPWQHEVEHLRRQQPLGEREAKQRPQPLQRLWEGQLQEGQLQEGQLCERNMRHEQRGRHLHPHRLIILYLGEKSIETVMAK
jgi:hypothetical protein